MANFNEHSLEMSIMELFQDEGYVYLNGEQIHRERSEVLLIDDLQIVDKQNLRAFAVDLLTIQIDIPFILKQLHDGHFKRMLIEVCHYRFPLTVSSVFSAHRDTWI